ncbi:MAG: DNA repair protein RadC [Myxococcales bacterium]|nr:DNA repair protein RadC [Myxococcales bacterium]
MPRPLPGRDTVRDRPRERLAALGPEALSDAELLALLLRTGDRSADALSLASALLERHGGLEGLARAGGREISALRGVGPAKSATVSASLEIGRRLAARRLPAGSVIRGPEDVYRHFHPSLRLVPHERFLVLLLNGRHRLLRQEVVSQGTLTASLVHPREVFRPALREAAAALILVHNHPSGDPTPSPEDREVTDRLAKAGEILGVRVLDHVVVAEHGYCSLREEGWLPVAGPVLPGGQAREPVRGPALAEGRLRAGWRSVDEGIRVSTGPLGGTGHPGRPSSMAKANVQQSAEPAAGTEYDRRKSDRTDLVVRVAYHTVDELFSEFARNINEGGLFVETEAPHPVGTEVSLQFKIPGSDEPLHVLGRIAHTTDGGPGEPPGMGIEFDDLDGQARQRINQLVRCLRTDAARP